MIGLLPSLGWAGLLTVVAMLFVLGFAPVFVVRCAVLLYPKGHLRRAELVAETAHVWRLRDQPLRWLWVGNVVAIAVFEGIPARRTARRRRRAGERARMPSAIVFTISQWQAHQRVSVTIQSPTGRVSDTIEVPWHVICEEARNGIPQGSVTTVRGPDATVRLAAHGGHLMISPAAPGRHRARRTR